MNQGSELAIVTAEIVDILPRQHQTVENKQWIEQSLQEGSVSEVLAACKEYFKVADGRITGCEKRLDAQGIKLDAHIAYVDQKFKTYDGEIAGIKQELAVVKAVSNERAQTQQFLNGQIMQGINSTQASITNVAAQSNRDSGGGNSVKLAFSIFFGIVLFSCMVAFGTKPPSQIIEYKNVPSGGHPTPIPRDLWEKI